MTAAKADAVLWLDTLGWRECTPDDWYEALAALLAERGPA